MIPANSPVKNTVDILLGGFFRSAIAKGVSARIS
jgi:hypothetical protein